MKKDTLNGEAVSTANEHNTIHDEWAAIPIGLLMHPELSLTEIRVFWQIMRFDGTERHCYATNAKIAEILNVHPMTVSKSIAVLIHNNLLEPISNEPRVLKRTDKWQLELRRVASVYNEKAYNKDIKSHGLSPLNQETNPPLANLLIPPKQNSLPNIREDNKENNKKREEEIFSYENMTNRKRSVKLLPRSLEDIPAKVRIFLKLWQEHGLYMPSNTTKGYRHCVDAVRKLLDGTVFNNTEYKNGNRRKYDNRDLKLAIERFADAAFNPHKLPVASVKKRMQQTSIGQFIFNEHVRPNGNGVASIPRSYFLYYLQHEPETTVKPVLPLEDEYPIQTRELIKAYRKKVLGTAKADFTIMENNDFILAAAKLKDFWKKNTNKIVAWGNINEGVMAECLVDAVISDVKNLQKITTGYINSDRTVYRRLPSYLHEQGVLQDFGYDDSVTYNN